MTVRILFLIVNLAIASKPILCQTNGYLKLDTNIDSFLVVIDQEYDNEIELYSEDSLLISTGTHHFRIISREINDYVFTAEIDSGETYIKKVNFRKYSSIPKRSSYPRYFWNANLIIHSEPNAEILIENQKVGNTVQGVLLPSGMYKVEVRNDDQSAFSNVAINNLDLKVLELSTLPYRKRAIFLSPIPGAGQFYKENYIRSGLFFLGISASLFAAYKLDLQLEQAEKDSERLLSMYIKATDPDLAVQYAHELENSIDKAESVSQRRNSVLITTGCLYIFNILDAVITPPKRGYYKKWNIDPMIDLDVEDHRFYGLSLKREF